VVASCCVSVVVRRRNGEHVKFVGSCLVKVQVKDEHEHEHEHEQQVVECR